MLAIQLAIKNLLGAGLRTWLNVSVLSFAFVVIVFYNGMLDGWNMQARNDTKAWETGYGQLWHPEYDRFDPFTLQDAHAPVKGKAEQLVQEKKLTPLLFVQASIYPQGRMQNALLKGIEPHQQILKIPSSLLQYDKEENVPAIIGKRMAASSKLKTGDRVLVRWRDLNGTFDAREITITGIFEADVPTVDAGYMYVPLLALQKMTGLTDQATLLVAGADFETQQVDGWKLQTEQSLLQELDDVIEAKKGSSKIIYMLLLAIALLAIFDTQVLSIFRRQKEIGTYIALGMTRTDVVKIFTVEGSAHSILALIVGAIYGIPFLWYLQKNGIPMPKNAADAGLAIADKIIPVYSAGMILSTIFLVVFSATVVSYFPTRKIARLKPTDALKGKII